MVQSPPRSWQRARPTPQKTRNSRVHASLILPSSSTPPPSHNPILSSAHKRTRRPKFRTPLHTPYFARILYRRNSSTCTDVPYFYGFICRAAFSHHQQHDDDNRSSTYPETANLPSGDISALKTQDEWPLKDATAPDVVLLGVEARTSNKVRCLSSDDERRS